jgi:hypothetical protein
MLLILCFGYFAVPGDRLALMLLIIVASITFVFCVLIVASICVLL